MRVTLRVRQMRRSYSGKEEYDINRVSRFESETIDLPLQLTPPRHPHVT